MYDIIHSFLIIAVLSYYAHRQHLCAWWYCHARIKCSLYLNYIKKTYNKIFLHARRRYNGGDNTTGQMTAHKRKRDGKYMFLVYASLCCIFREGGGWRKKRNAYNGIMHIMLCNPSTGVLCLHKHRTLVITVYINIDISDRGSFRAYEYPTRLAPPSANRN